MPYGPQIGWGKGLICNDLLGYDPLDNFSGEDLPLCKHANSCRLQTCKIPRLRYVYGLWDTHIDNIFYVGSTFSLIKRFKRHLRENNYIQRMIERGAFPIPIALLEFETQCESYSRVIEHKIALQLRKQGHYAFGDDIWDKRYAEVLDNQARHLSFLKEIYSW